MPHIHTEPGQHDQTASAYIIRTDFDEPKILLHLHKKLGRWMQFGGHVELNENPWQTLVHELREESGYDLDQLQILQPQDRLKIATNGILHPVAMSHNTHNFEGMPSKHYHSDLTYVFVTDQEPRHERAKGESAQLKLFTKKEALKLDTFSDIVEAIDFAMSVCLPKWERVPTSEFNQATPA